MHPESARLWWEKFRASRKGLAEIKPLTREEAGEIVARLNPLVTQMSEEA